MPVSTLSCGICALHADQVQLDAMEIWRHPDWLLRHHPQPSPLLGWCCLDARRHLSGPIDFTAEEAQAWGLVVQRASQLVQELTRCDRVYAIAFGEGARHLHLHLIPRHGEDSQTTAWAVADHYRAVEAGERPAAESAAVQAWIHLARERVIAPDWLPFSADRSGRAPSPSPRR
jgi:diadenosine tetraphosphate (Ap4A) HIT family hydrolase